MTWLMDTFQQIDEGITTRAMKLAEYVYDPRDLIAKVWNMLTTLQQDLMSQLLMLG